MAQQIPPFEGPPSERVTHYAVVSTGPAFGERLAGLYWGVNDGMHRVLRAYGYPDEAIYRFGDYEDGESLSRDPSPPAPLPASGARGEQSAIGSKKPPNVDGKATLKNLRATLDHLRQNLTPDDHVFIMLVGHGRRGETDYCHPLLDGKLTATEFGKRLSDLPTENLTVVIHPCHSGGFLPRVSRHNCVIVTSVNADEVNAVPWAEAFIEAFAKPHRSDADEDPRVSILEAYHAALKPAKDRYGDDLREHPLLDDNGDRVGTYLGTKHFFNGDGQLAARRFLGHSGSKLKFTENAIRDLARRNADLVLE